MTVMVILSVAAIMVVINIIMDKALVEVSSAVVEHSSDNSGDGGGGSDQ